MTRNCRNELAEDANLVGFVAFIVPSFHLDICSVDTIDCVACLCEGGPGSSVVFVDSIGRKRRDHRDQIGGRSGTRQTSDYLLLNSSRGDHGDFVPSHRRRGNRTKRRVRDKNECMQTVELVPDGSNKNAGMGTNNLRVENTSKFQSSVASCNSRQGGCFAGLPVERRSEERLLERQDNEIEAR